MLNKLLFTILCCLGLVVSTKSSAQIDPMIGVTSEFTVAGTLFGGYAGVKFSDKIGVGALYETRTRQFDSRFNENLNFLGIFTSFRLVNEGKMEVNAFLRGGYENDRFIIVVPSLNFSYYFTDKINVFCMAGIRSEKPSLGFGMFYRLKGRNQ